uniref:Uncharacterized protein n=1 Tax=Aegilops tauschii subsp. strangulata TaxID=200361 RepID=A0A453LDP2_AEGTS
MRVVIEGTDEVNETMHDRDQNSEIVPYSPSATLMNQYPSASYQPSAFLFERVILQKRPEECIHDLAVCTFHLQFFIVDFVLHVCNDKLVASTLHCLISISEGHCDTVIFVFNFFNVHPYVFDAS